MSFLSNALPLAAVAQEVGAALGREEAAAGWGLGSPYYLGAGILTLVLVVVHLLAPQLRERLRGRTPIVSSFGGGMAVAYVFLHLLPELDKGHELLGLLIFAVPLAGFIVHYLVLRLCKRKSHHDATGVSGTFVLLLLNLAVYNWLIVYGTPEAGIESGWLTAPIVLMLVAHLMQADLSFGEESPRCFDSIGRYVLAAAALCGYLIIVVEQRTNEAITDILMAFLAGSVLFNVFREEIPDERQSRIGWFIGGIVLFTASAAVSAG